MKILLAGGGSGGPVAPLLAVAQEIKKILPQTHFLLVGTSNGPEKLMAESQGIAFAEISSGKLRRYFSWKNFAAPFKVLQGLFQARRLLKSFAPDCVVGAGGFVQVPVIWAAWLARVPCLIHQQDVAVSMANRICQLAASMITVSLPDSLKDFSSGPGLFYQSGKEKVFCTGNPCRTDLSKVERREGLERFGLKPDWPVLLVLGGGTGAAALNQLVKESLPELSKTVQILHSHGSNTQAGDAFDHYQPRQFIQDMPAAYAAADLVLCRAGFSTITELAFLEKIAIVVPMPNGHQELNSEFLRRRRAALVFEQNRLSPEILTRIVRRLLFERELQENMRKNIGQLMPKDSALRVAEKVIELCGE